MNGNPPLPDGFTWAGNLHDTDIRSLYAACHSLRFSGRLQLADGPQRAEVLFVAGEPVEIDGGDTQRISLWANGTFRAVQSIPSLSGELLSEREIRGVLAETKPSQLWAWVSEYRLSCEIELERPGSKAVVSFQNGHAESAQVNGAPELAALARVSSWTDGSFHVRLKPLFVDGVIPVAAPMTDGAPPIDPRSFDVSKSIPMDLKNKPNTPRPPPVANRLPTPPLGELALGGASFAAPSTQQDRSQATIPISPHQVRLPALRDKDTGRPPTEELSARDMLPARRGKAIWIVTIVLVLAAGGAGALYYFHLPPFSPPPKPIVEEPKPAEAKPTEEAKPEEAKPTEEAKPAEAKPVEAKPAEAKPTEAKPVEAKPVEKPAPPVEEEKPLNAKARANQEKAEKLIAKARQLLVEGHEHTALDELKKAEKLASGKLASSLKVYEQQAMGKLGRAELVIEGKSPVVVDGHKFTPPRKVKLPAGPHSVNLGDGDAEVELKRGEKKKLKGKK
jgi:hypothetical protein